jgi:hypothetical protein
MPPTIHGLPSRPTDPTHEARSVPIVDSNALLIDPLRPETGFPASRD